MGGRLTRSQVEGGRPSHTRTSEQIFLKMSETPMLNAIQRRAADLLNITDHDLGLAAEDLQVVRYAEGQEYQSHFDYGLTNGRLLTLLIYLDPPDAGGGTFFKRPFSDRGLLVKPGRGSAVLFYSQLPDGNLEELSVHAGADVEAGVKWVCNLWVRSQPRRPTTHSAQHFLDEQ